MTYVRRWVPPAHTCNPPMRKVVITVPKGPALSPSRETVELPAGVAPDGTVGDLWRCDDCAKLWRVGRACPVCDGSDRPWSHGGTCIVGTRWRPATWWQRFRYRRTSAQ